MRRHREAIEARRRKVLVSVASLAHLLLLKVIGCMAAQSAKIIWHNMQESIQGFKRAVVSSFGTFTGCEFEENWRGLRLQVAESLIFQCFEHRSA